MTMPDMSEILKSVQDTLTVMEGIQSRQASALQDHSEWLQAHDQAVNAHREWLKEHDRVLAEERERGRLLDERIARLVSGIGELITEMRESRR